MTKSTNALTHPTAGPQLDVVRYNLDMVSHTNSELSYLTPKAQEALSRKSTTRIINTSDGVFNTAYLCIQVNTDCIENGITKLAFVINDLASADLIHSCFTPISSLSLGTLPMQHNRSLVFCFLMVPVAREAEVRAIAGDILSPEGGAGPSLGSPYKELPEGQFYAEVVLSYNALCIGAAKEATARLKVREYINLLPKGTEVISIKECSFFQLSIPYEVILSNPLMKQFKEVKLVKCRFAEIVDDKVEQFNLLLSVEYMKRDGTVVKV